MTSLIAIVPRLEKLLPLLSSSQAGEVVATAAAISRTLATAGADWHDLTAALTRAAPLRAELQGGVAPVTWRDIADSEQAGWLARMRVSHLLTSWERDFASSILEQIREWPRRTLSEKQAAVLDRLVRKIADTRR